MSVSKEFLKALGKESMAEWVESICPGTETIRNGVVVPNKYIHMSDLFLQVSVENLKAGVQVLANLEKPVHPSLVEQIEAIQAEQARRVQTKPKSELDR